MREDAKCVAEPRKYEVEEVLNHAQETRESIRELTGRVQDIQLVYTGERPMQAGSQVSPMNSCVGGTCGEILSVLREIDAYTSRMSEVLSHF